MLPLGAEPVALYGELTSLRHLQSPASPVPWHNVHSVAEDDSDSEAGSGEEEEEEESSSEPECEPEASSSSGSDGEEEEDSEEEASEEEADTKAGRASPAAVAAAEKPREGVAEASGKASDNDDAASFSTVATGISSMRISGRPTPAVSLVGG